MQFVISIMLTAFLASGAAHAQDLAQSKVRTETIRPPGGKQTFQNDGRAVPLEPADKLPEIITDPARLPAAVLLTRERILNAARSGDLRKLLAVMQAAGAMPIFSFSDESDPVAFWTTNYPDSDGIEALSILINVL